MKQQTTDQRDPDQDTAMEKAFIAGTLPEEDRRPYTAPKKAAAIEKPASFSAETPSGETVTFVEDVGSQFATDNAKPPTNVV